MWGPYRTLRKPKKPTVKQSFDLFTGVFEHIDNPVWGSTYSAEDMTLEFLTSYGEKPISPLVEHFKKPDVYLTEQEVTRIMNLIYRKKRESWTRYYEVLGVVYNVLDNYYLTETENVDRESLESNIRDVLRESNLTTSQVNEIVANVKRTDDLARAKTGKDTSSNKNISKTTSKDEGSVTTTRTDNTTEREMYENRKDIETRNLEKSGKSTDKTIDKRDESTTYIDRTDTRKTNRTDNKTDIDTSKSKDVKVTTDDTNKTELLYAPNGTENTSVSATAEPTNKTVNGGDMTDTTDSTGEVKRKSDVKGNEDEILTKNGTDKFDADNYNEQSKEYEDFDKGSLTNEKQGSEIKTNTGTVKSLEERNLLQTDNATDTTTADTIYGSTETDKGTVQTDNNTTDTQSGENVESESTSDTANNTNNMTEVRTLERKGNIGVNTTAKILQDHIDFWSFSFLDLVYKDVADMVALSIYEREEERHGDFKW